MTISDKIQEIKSEIPATVSLIAVSKTKPIEKLKEAYEGGQLDFGENKVQELTDKFEVLPKDIRWHFIGHLQTNKVKYIAPFVHLIHSVDSFKLLKEIDKEGRKNNRIIPVLIQFHIATEDTKYGFFIDEVEEMFSDVEFENLKNIQIKGVMGMATFTEDLKVVENEFSILYQIFQILKETYFPNQPEFKEISMGMSGDYLTAIKCGSTMVRIGSTIFGGR